ncbi:MAG: UdgX family uracil-DNA binding protein [Dongia sp.]
MPARPGGFRGYPPETRAIPALVQEAPARGRVMIEREAAMPTRRDPEKAVAAMADQEPKSLTALNRLIAATEPLVAHGVEGGAGHAVLGEGPIGAEIAFVGEQPGDQEDRAGKPFVGPAGMLLNRAMEEAGIDRRQVYVTNAVKHFKFEQRGKKRIHRKPTMGEVKRYRWWLMKELDFVHPKLVVALGGTAAAALAGKAVSVTKARGRADFDGRPGFITVHPSYLLRIPDADAKQEAYNDFVRDLKRIHQIAA